jgi:AcrR family transcriptional regulator
VFAEAGAHGLTMRRLAAEAGYSPGTIYLYFPSRRDLLREVWKEDMVALRDRFALAVETGSPLQRVRALCHCWADFWFEQPDHFKAMFLEVERQYVSERAAFAEDESVQDLNRLFVTHTAAAVSAGELAPISPVVLTHSLLAAIHGVVTLHIGNAGFPWSDRQVMVDTVVDAMLRGLAPAA